MDYLLGKIIQTVFITSAFCLFFFGFLFFGIGSSCTSKQISSYYEKKAIQKGYGKKLIIDSITGETKFFWMDSLPENLR